MSLKYFWEQEIEFTDDIFDNLPIVSSPVPGSFLLFEIFPLQRKLIGEMYVSRYTKKIKCYLYEKIHRIAIQSILDENSILNCENIETAKIIVLERISKIDKIKAFI